MYLAHFGLKEMPFSLTSDTRYFFGLRSHVDAANTCVSAVAMGEGLVKVIGEVGTGKTILCRMLLHQLQDDFTLVYLPNPAHSITALYYMISRELGIISRIAPEQLLGHIQLRCLEAAFSGKPVVMLCDEAQALPDEVFEAMRLLGNLETEQRKLVQIVLFGQPELDVRLNQYNMRQILQRITFSASLKSLTFAETLAYINYRLEKQGAAPQLFTYWAKWQVWSASNGIPRLIHQLCHKSLLLGYGRGKAKITRKLVKLAIKDTPQAARQNLLKAMLWR